MRIRIVPVCPRRVQGLVVAGLLAAALVVAVQAPASAQDPGTKAGEHLVECVEEALENNEAGIADEDYDGFENALEDCKKAPGLISPAVPELIWGSLAFAIVAFVLMKFAFPGIKKSLKAREEKIRGDLEAAEQAKLDAEEEKRTYEAQIAQARGEANRIVEEAREAAEQVRRDVVAKAEQEATEVRARAQEDARLAQQRAMADLRSQVAETSVELAGKIVERTLDPATQRDLVESFIGSVGGDGR